jgi:hypothetical protein
MLAPQRDAVEYQREHCDERESGGEDDYNRGDDGEYHLRDHQKNADYHEANRTFGVSAIHFEIS